MSLTYRPFDHVPQIQALGDELHCNVSNLERVISACAGACLVLKGLGRGRIAKWSLMTAGTALINRAWTGHCPLYEEMEVSRRRREQQKAE